MIPVASTLTKNDSIPGERIEFTIGDPRWMMKMAAKQYSDVTTAIIREYSTNAYDANVMVGSDKPIEITLPSSMNNGNFIVKDSGPGMNREDFINVYTRFGISEKRERNDTNGMLGIGSKSGVAYTDQFTVVSVKDGIKTAAIVAREPDWSIALKIVSTVKTNEPNGTTITIAIHDIEEFNYKAKEFYKWWLPGRVLVNGVEPVQNVGEKITDSLYYCSGHEWNTSYVVMGNVAYRIANPSVLFHGSKINQINFVAYVDNADVEFVPSREDLEYSAHTKRALQKIVDDFQDEILALAKSEIDNCATHAEAYAAWHKWSGTLGKSLFGDLEFNGDKFVSDFPVSGKMYQPQGGRGSSAYNVNAWNVESMERTLVVTDYDCTLSSRHKEMVREVIRLNDWKVTYVIFTVKGNASFDSPWYSKEKFLTWDEVKEQAPKRVPKISSRYNPNAGRIPGSWDYYDKDGIKRQQTIPSNSTLFYVTLNEERNIAVHSILKALDLDNAFVILMPMNRLEKFLRDNPTARRFIKFAREQVIIDEGTLYSDEQKNAMSISGSTRNIIELMDVTRLYDPRFTEFKKIMDVGLNCPAADDNRALARMLRMEYDVKQYEPPNEVCLVEEYPLLRYRSRYNNSDDNEYYIYINAKYLAESESN